MSAEVYQGNVLREKWDDTTRTYTAYDEGGVQTSTRPYSPEENTVADDNAIIDTANKNKSTIENQAVSALSSNSDYIALANPTNAQVAAQVKALTRQNNKIIRLVLGRLDGTD